VLTKEKLLDLKNKLTTVQINASWELPLKITNGSPWAAHPFDRKTFNNLSIARKNRRRHLWRQERQVVQDKALQMCEAEDNRFMERFIGEQK